MNPNPTRGFRNFLRRYGALCALGIVAVALGVTYALTGGQTGLPETEPSPTVKLEWEEELQPTQKPLTGLDLEEPDEADETSEEAGLFGLTACLERPVSGEVNREYAMDRLIWQPTLLHYSTHAGVDITAEEGEDVLAAADGTVTRVYEDALHGNCVLIEHDNGLETFYASLGAVTVEEGQAVSQGEAIGTAGNTGICEVDQGVHLHFEVRKDGQTADPVQLFLS